MVNTGVGDWGNRSAEVPRGVKGGSAPYLILIPYPARKLGTGGENNDQDRGRSAGGRATDDAIRSLVISYKLLGTREWFVVHHTDCGMLLFTNDDMRNLLASSLKTATLDQGGWHETGAGPGSTEGTSTG